VTVACIRRRTTEVWNAMHVVGSTPWGAGKFATTCRVSVSRSHRTLLQALSTWQHCLLEFGSMPTAEERDAEFGRINRLNFRKYL